MSPDDHFANLKRLIQAVGWQVRPVSVIMPSLYGGRQHSPCGARKSGLRCGLQELQTMGVQHHHL